eukprot:TRINITY_DN12056_c0_g2_i3.p1 TRINITY_DN12056_c0_g2~~TRINITY_DN12056_c0_g2_i3.p1  ORF type:complete len:281 (+),score=27.65 TRINITY_DN12056_c0_g2_i3:182-1024(+)
MLKPLADALRNTLQYNTTIWFGLPGAMGATILYNPYSYIEAIEMLRDVIVSESQIQPNLEFGLGFNFNKLCGCVLMDVVDTVEYIDRFPDAIAPVLNTFDVEGLQALFEVIDFVGISSYAQLKPYFATPELQNAIYYFDREISEFGVDLRQLMKNGLDLHFMEYGVGGGSSQEGGGRAATQDEVAQFPFFWNFWCLQQRCGSMGDVVLQFESGPSIHALFLHIDHAISGQCHPTQLRHKQRVFSLALHLQRACYLHMEFGLLGCSSYLSRFNYRSRLLSR